SLIERATGLLTPLGAEAVGSDDLGCSMRSFHLPQRRPAERADAEELVTRLWERDRIRCWTIVFGSRLLLRVSAQVYVDDEDLVALAEAVGRDGWAGRS